MKCSICPRKCRIDRAMQPGQCHETQRIRLSRAAKHYGEEPCISGINGSGAVFFSGCPLQCVFCQNKSISTGTIGKEISVQRFAEIVLKLQSEAAHNINLVSPTQFIPQIKNGLLLAKSQGLTIPVVYNTSGYERPESLRALEGLIDVYLPDYKYDDPILAERYSDAPDYPEIIRPAIEEMMRQCGDPLFDDCGIMKRGVIVRHLVLPNQIRQANRIIAYLFNRYGNSVYLSLMCQYTPMGNLSAFPELNRTLTVREYERVIDFSVRLGVKNAYIQDFDSVGMNHIPSFDLTGI